MFREYYPRFVKQARSLQLREPEDAAMEVLISIHRAGFIGQKHREQFGPALLAYARKCMRYHVRKQLEEDEHSSPSGVPDGVVQEDDLFSGIESEDMFRGSVSRVSDTAGVVLKLVSAGEPVSGASVGRAMGITQQSGYERLKELRQCRSLGTQK